MISKVSDDSDCSLGGPHFITERKNQLKCIDFAKFCCLIGHQALAIP